MNQFQVAHPPPVKRVQKLLGGAFGLQSRKLLSYTGSEKPSIFVPANDPNASQWFYVDVPAIAGACGLPENTLYIEDINENVNPSSPYPIPKDANTLIQSSVMPQDHLNYMLTWYFIIPLLL
ncbi:UNVERIFIED_CONTAM: Surfeit locus protein 1 [Sesamum radiatum]|uniref:SURF1-like protein n=1 Tax=Sesamum radiatum TaxID=300843 RepID=A0AAW2WKU2_SESRA